MSRFGQFAATSQFFLYGRKHFTRTGWERHRAAYEQPDLLSPELDLSERVYIVTGGNAGVGREVAQFLAGRQATVHIVCRSRQRGEGARAEIVAQTGNQRVHLLEADVSLEADVRRCWREFKAMGSGSAQPRLDGLVCNAGAMAHEKTLTSEGVEVTFASHLLFGTYLLGSLAMPALEATAGSRLVVVSSGGMYNFAFPSWEVATSTSMDPKAKFDGQAAYAFAKRGQVLLCERWAQQHQGVKVVSCHPGWTSTAAVEAAYGKSKNLLEPMRTPWEGAEGIAWLCVAPEEKLESGAFYLDRAPQVKHMAGAFFTEGNFTKNSSESVDGMMRCLQDWAESSRRPGDLAEQEQLVAAGTEASRTPLVALQDPIDISKFMGRWHVIANIPTAVDRDTVNNVEEYTYDEGQRMVNVNFTYSNKEFTKTSSLKQRAFIRNDACTEWSISPKVGIYLPLKIPYLIAHCAEDYSSAIIGVPDRSYVWVMTREAQPAAETVKELMKKVQLLGYNPAKLTMVPSHMEN
mmetsp:Transcript_134522/g.287809  ORF Transcript_134522/g.287809 Transcript_134522/m.287809 type:complete len:519 (-) Transcript_134522:165-1721(-)